MEPWLGNTLTALSAAGLFYAVFKYTTGQPPLPPPAANAEVHSAATSETTPILDLCDQLELEHGEIIRNTQNWSSFTHQEVSLAGKDGSISDLSLIRVAVFYREADRDKVYDKLRRKGFTGLDICFFETPMLVLSIRPCELHRLEKLPALYQRVSTGEIPRSKNG